MLRSDLSPTLPLCLLLACFPAEAQETPPEPQHPAEALGERYHAALAKQDYAALVACLHRQELKALQQAFLDMRQQKAENPDLDKLWSILFPAELQTREAFAAAQPAAVGEVFLRATLRQQALRKGRMQVLGSVSEGPDVRYVIWEAEGTGLANFDGRANLLIAGRSVDAAGKEEWGILLGSAGQRADQSLARIARQLQLEPPVWKGPQLDESLQAFPVVNPWQEGTPEFELYRSQKALLDEPRVMPIAAGCLHPEALAEFRRQVLALTREYGRQSLPGAFPALKSAEAAEAMPPQDFYAVVLDGLFTAIGMDAAVTAYRTRVIGSHVQGERAYVVYRKALGEKTPARLAVAAFKRDGQRWKLLLDAEAAHVFAAIEGMLLGHREQD